MEDKAVGREIKCLSNLLKRLHFSSNVLKECDKLTGMHGFLIGYLFSKAQDGDVFQRDIENTFEMRRSTASEILKLMEKNGLILRESVDYDARLKRIILTDKAKAIHNRVHEHMQSVETLMMQGVDEMQAQVFFDVLKKIKNNVANELNKQ